MMTHSRLIAALILVLTLGSPLHLSGIERDFTTTTVGNTAAETQLYAFTVPANLLSTRRGVRILMWGDYLNNSGGNRTLTFRLRFGTAGTGGTLVATKTTDNLASQAVTGQFFLEAILVNTGATNAQAGAFYFQIDRAAEVSAVVGTGTSALDTTAAQSITITVQHSGAAAATVTLSEFGTHAQLI